jgi:hypothetical protein
VFEDLPRLHLSLSILGGENICGMPRFVRKFEPVNEQPLLRSEKQFDFKEDCLFCGASVVENSAKRKTFDVHAVRLRW